MKKYVVLFDIINNSIIFFPIYYMHLKAFLFPILPKLEETEVILEANN